MKKQKTKKRLFILSFIFAGLFILAGCLEGPPGKDGKDGEDGVDGVDGVDGTSMEIDSTLLASIGECKTCHDGSEDMTAKQLQYGNSGHATLGDFERSTASCAGCHTSEGFRIRIETGEAAVEEDVLDPTPQNCKTCHFIHTNYDSTDFALRVPADENIMIHFNGEEVSFGKGNVCATCHQPRGSADDLPVPGGDDFEITSSRFGPHHGPQSTMLKGMGAVEIPGSLEYENSDHATEVEDGCTECHMGQAYGAAAGGHNFYLEYEYHGSTRSLTTGCVACHEDAVTDFNYDDVATTLQELMDTLTVRLQTAGALDSTGATVTGTYPANVAGALWNLRTVEEDKSMGNHNFPYARAMLQNSIEAVEAELE